MPTNPVARDIRHVLSMDVTGEIASFANAHRQAMDIGDKTLKRVDEKAILLAMVAKSATDTLSWIKTRVPDPDRHAALFADLAAELEAKNFVGKGLHLATKHLLSQAKQLTLSAVGAGMTPVWVTSGIAFLAGFLGSVLHFGSAVGGVLALGFFFVASTAVICPPFRMAVFRSLGRTPQAVGAVGRSVKELAVLAISTLSYPGSVGAEAQRIFVGTIGQEGGAFPYPGYTLRESRLVLTPLRMLVGVIVWVSMLLLVVSLVFFVIGIHDGFAQQANVCGQYSTSSYCGLNS